MGIFDFLKAPDINQGVQQFLSTPGAILLDVREVSEYQQGHIPRSRNLPLSRFDTLARELPDKAVPLFVYCLSGSRSSQAVAYLQRAGYTAVTNIGGISAYSGEVET